MAELFLVKLVNQTKSVSPCQPVCWCHWGKGSKRLLWVTDLCMFLFALLTKGLWTPLAYCCSLPRLLACLSSAPSLQCSLPVFPPWLVRGCPQCETVQWYSNSHAQVQGPWRNVPLRQVPPCLAWQTSGSNVLWQVEESSRPRGYVGKCFQRARLKHLSLPPPSFLFSPQHTMGVPRRRLWPKSSVLLINLVLYAFLIFTPIPQKS